MATKPDPVNDLPPAWGGAGVYPASTYPLLQPWGTSNPLGGGATPWSGMARLNAAGLIAFADAGLTPQIPNDASSFNEWLRRVQTWSAWVAAGTSSALADTHVVETDANGIVSAQKFQATLGYCNAGITSAVMLAGATIPNGEDLAMVGSAKLAGNNGTEAELGVVNFLSGGAPPGAKGIGVGGTGGAELFYGASERIHHSPGGWIYATGDQEAATGMAATQQVCETTVAITGISTGDVRAIVVIEAQLSALPNAITINVQEDQTANPAWTNIGAAKVITGTHTAADANAWQTVKHERVFAAGTSTATKYRVQLTGGGGNINVKEGRLRVVNERG